MNKYKEQSRWKESRGCVAKRRFDTYYHALWGIFIGLGLGFYLAK